MYLVDTNVWLERFLEQERAEGVRLFLDSVGSEEISITDFAFHSICVVLSKLGQQEALLRFVQDSFVDGSVNLICLGPELTGQIISAMQEFGLDYDDAYQYVSAERHDLILVSFDGDFDRTTRGRKTPEEILRG